MKLNVENALPLFRNFRVERTSRVQSPVRLGLSASRRNRLPQNGLFLEKDGEPVNGILRKVRDGVTPSPARETRALSDPQRSRGYYRFTRIDYR
jgi:hypothetical protein